MNKLQISAWREALRIGLYCLTQLLDKLEDWALKAHLPGVRRLLYDQRKVFPGTRVFLV